MGFFWVRRYTSTEAYQSFSEYAKGFLLDRCGTMMFFDRIILSSLGHWSWYYLMIPFLTSRISDSLFYTACVMAHRSEIRTNLLLEGFELLICEHVVP